MPFRGFLEVKFGADFVAIAPHGRNGELEGTAIVVGNAMDDEGRAIGPDLQQRRKLAEALFVIGAFVAGRVRDDKLCREPQPPGQFDGMQPPGSRFGGPHFLALDSRERLYTTEGMHGRVQQLTLAGLPLAAWGSKRDEPGGFGSLETGFAKMSFGPIAVMVDRHDRVWVSSLNSTTPML